jgi:uroporphyrinogen-III decarboxylase
MDTFTDMAVAWGVAQARRGCHAIKVSSPYGGAGFLSPDQYREWVLPYERRIAEAVKAEGAFCYDHTCGAIGDRLELMCETGIDGIETLDPPPLGTVELSEAKRLLKDRLFIKGNVDPVNTILNKDRAQARTDIEHVCEVGQRGGQYILSTACSVPPRAPPENVREMTECVHARTAKLKTA